MLLSALALATAIAAPACTDSCCGSDWRKGLPGPVLAAIHRVDDKQEPQASKDDERLKRDVESDIKLGQEYSKEVDKELKPSEDKEMTERVQRIGAELAAIANSTQASVLWGDSRHAKFPYVFKLVKGDDVNAFSIPGGFIYIYEGLVKFTESDDELAGVVAHEISHAAFRHVAVMQRQSSRLDLLQLPLLIAALLSGRGDLAAAAEGVGMAGAAFRSGWSVKAETSADYGAIQYMQLSKYNPVGVLTMMERLGWKERANPQIDWGIYRTHPPGPERAAFILAKLRERNVPIRRSHTSTSLRAASRIVDEGGIEVVFNGVRIHVFRGDGAIDRSEDAVSRLNTFFDTAPALFELSRVGFQFNGAGVRLFEVQEQDLPAGASRETETTDVQRRLQAVLFDLSYRLWARPDLAIPRS